MALRHLRIFNYCPACSAKRLKAKKGDDREIKLLAER